MLLPSRKADSQAYMPTAKYTAVICIILEGAGLVAQTSAVQYLDSLEPQFKILAGSAEIFSFPSELKK